MNNDLLYISQLESVIFNEENKNYTLSFTGIREDEFSNEKLIEGVETKSIVINYEENEFLNLDPIKKFASCFHPHNFLTSFIDPASFMSHLLFCETPDNCHICYTQQRNIFYIIKTEQNYKDNNSYFYSLFSNEFNSDSHKKNTYATVIGLIQKNIPSFKNIDFSSTTSKLSQSDWKLAGFYVGQGMSTIAYNDESSFIIDAGAGTPIKLANYDKNNEIKTLIKNKNNTFILSHADRDHWRLLAWDPDLRNSINKIIVPDDMRYLAFFDKTIKNKIVSLPTRPENDPFKIILNDVTKIYLYRAEPKTPTSNNDGIIVVFKKKDKFALIPGDCSYREIASDNNNDIRDLVAAGKKYSVLIVPHHGAEESKNGIPDADSNPIAFFSAGDHKSYKHPRKNSILSHENKGFTSRLPYQCSLGLNCTKDMSCFDNHDYSKKITREDFIH